MAQFLQHFYKEVFAYRAPTTLSIAIEIQNKNAKYFFNNLLDEFLQTLVELKVEIAYSERFKGFEYYNLLLIDSYASFREIDVGLRTVKQDFSEFYLIVLYTENYNWQQELQLIFDYCWGYYIVNVDVLVYNKISAITLLSLYTYYPFSSAHCNKALIRQLSSGIDYKNFTFTEFYPKKFRNFYNCPLVAALWHVPPYLVLPKSKYDPLKFDGMEGHLLRNIADFLNFTIDYIIPANNAQRGLIMKNGTVTGAIRLLKEKRADLSLGSFRCTLERSIALSATQSFYQTMQVYTVLASKESWSSYEIFAYPFGYWVWISLGCIFLSLAVIILTLYYLQPTLLAFIYGFANIRVITLNLISLILGYPVKRVPRRNFARYLHCLCLLLTLVLRSAYQGLLYEFMNSQKTIAPPNTAQQLTQRDYQLIVNTATADSFSEVPIIRNKLLKILIMNITDSGGFAILEALNKNRFVTGTPRDFLTHYVLTHKKYGVFHVVKESIFSQQLCMYFTKHSYLTARFDEVLLNLRSFGLIDHWAALFMDYTALEKKDNSEKETISEPLDMADMYCAFQMHYCLWLLASGVFIAELLWVRWCVRDMKLKFTL